MTVEKPNQKQLLRPIMTETNSAMNQSQFLAITCNSTEARERSRVHGAMIGFGFDSHWLQNWRDSFKPITKRSNRNHVITFDSHFKTALTWKLLFGQSECTFLVCAEHLSICAFIWLSATTPFNLFLSMLCFAVLGMLGTIMTFQDGTDLKQTYFLVLGEDTGSPLTHPTNAKIMICRRNNIIHNNI